MNLYVLLDYQGRFGSKHTSVPYRSGFDLNLLKNSFERNGINVIFLNFSEILFSEDWKGKFVIYTGSEDNGYYYKSYIEDVIYNLELLGAIVIPSYRYLRCNNNKVFMEMQRYWLLPDDRLSAFTFGTIEEAKLAVQQKRIKFPCVVKAAEGACSSNVLKAETPEELYSAIKKMCATKNLKNNIKDYLRKYKYKGYVMESLYRHKFIIQPMVEGLANDWKLLIFGNKFFPLKRCIRKNDFRASGSHYNYSAGTLSGIPKELMLFGNKMMKKMDLPMISIDVAIQNCIPYMIEFQALYFGSSTYFMTDKYFELNNGEWKECERILPYEELFANCISDYLKNYKI